MPLKRSLPFLIVLAVLAAGVAGFWYTTRPTQPNTLPLRLSSLADATGFARVIMPRPFVFPADHGPHYDYQTEWWYYTGNLTTASGAHVGYQLTIFRRGLTPQTAARPSDFGTNQVYFAHFAITDVNAGSHTAAERFSRGAAGLAGASGAPFHVWLEDWRVDSLTADGSTVHLVARDGAVGIDLSLSSTKAIVAHGNHGLSPKSQAPGNASYYLSYTRLDTTGMVTLANSQPAAVTGESWFDHEWSTSALGAADIGWDWFSLQLSDRREVMFFQIRRADGALEPVSGGTLVAPDGTARQLMSGEVQIDALAHWHSPASGADYPSRWRLRVPSAGLDIEATPWLPDQEMRLSFVYWEGAVRLLGNSQGTAITGGGYVEMTGYSNSIAGLF